MNTILQCVLVNVHFSVSGVVNISMQPWSGGALEKEERGKIHPADRMDGGSMHTAEYWTLHTINCKL